LSSKLGWRIVLLLSAELTLMAEMKKVKNAARNGLLQTAMEMS
jgi:hypothetical protein